MDFVVPENFFANYKAITSEEIRAILPELEARNRDDTGKRISKV